MTTRRPPGRRLMCTIRSSAEASCRWIDATGRSAAISTSTSSRSITSRALLAWTVVIEPSWPVFMAWIMSSASAPRHSPTMIRSGRMRRAFFTRSRIVYSPAPSTFGGLVSSVTTCSWCSRSSVVSSMVTIRSLNGMKLREHVEHRRLAGAGAAADEDVAPVDDAGPQERGRRRG